MENVYKIKKINSEETVLCIQLDGTVLWIPEDENNRHYQEYLAWLAEGNTPEEIVD
jgi:hypothetical protein